MTIRPISRGRKSLPLVAATLAALVSLSFAPAALAQQHYPSHPVRLVVGFAPGGPTDVQARLLARELEPVLGQTVIVENKAGASTTIALNDVARAAPDGYTLYFGGSGAYATTPLTMPQLPYDPARSFRPVALVGEEQIAFAVNPAVPAKTLSELVALVRAAPGKYSFGSSGQGNITHLTGELFLQRAGGLKMTHVAYKGAAPAAADVLAGHIPMVIGGLSSVYPAHQQHKLRVLAISSVARVPYASDIPTTAEAGVKDLVATSTLVLLAPARTPDAIVEALNQAVNKTLARESYRQDMRNGYVEPVAPATPEQAGQLLTREIAQWRNLVKQAGIELN